MFKYYDRIKETSISTGTGNFALDGVESTSFIRFSDVFLQNYRFPYTISSESQYETGIGYLNGLNELVRETLLSSSDVSLSGGTAVYSVIDFGSGSKNVFVSAPAKITPLLNAGPSGAATFPHFLVYALNNNSDNFEWQLTPLTGGGGNLNPFPNLNDNRIIFTNNNGQITVDDNLQFDADSSPNLLEVTGDLYVHGNIKGQAKLFSIPHPTIPDKILNHGSLEGPELGIYVRENFTIHKYYTMCLPDYMNEIAHNYSIFINTKDGSRIKWELHGNNLNITRCGIHFSPTDISVLIIGSRKDIKFTLVDTVNNVK